MKNDLIRVITGAIEMAKVIKKWEQVDMECDLSKPDLYLLVDFALMTY